MRRTGRMTRQLVAIFAYVSHPSPSAAASRSLLAHFVFAECPGDLDLAWLEAAARRVFIEKTRLAAVSSQAASKGGETA